MKTARRQLSDVGNGGLISAVSSRTYGQLVAVVSLAATMAIASAGTSLSQIHVSTSFTGINGFYLQSSGQATSPGLKLLPDAGATPTEALFFGESVAVDGNYAVVGAPSDDNGATNQGSARVFVRSGATWTEAASLSPTIGNAQAQFGFSVSLTGTVVLVGAPGSESAHIFLLTGRTWTEEAKLSTSSLTSEDRFGQSVAIDGDYAVIGAPSAGVAYVFERSGDTWVEVARLAPTGTGTATSFGNTVAISGDAIIIGGGEGPATIYRRQNGAWNQETALVSPGSTDFGTSVGIYGDLAVVGARGSAHLFAFSNSGWKEIDVLIGSDTVPADYYGASVGVTRHGVIVGAPEKRDPEGNLVGAAYLFEFRYGEWVEASKLSPNRGVVNGRFGGAVAIDFDQILIGAIEDGEVIIAPNPPDDPTGQFTGAAYLFRR